MTSRVTGARTIVGYAVAESLRRRVVAVVGVLTIVFLGLYGLGVNFAFQEIDTSFYSGQDLVDERALVGGTIFGLAMFGTLFLGSVLAIFLTNGVVRGDAEAGLLQPLVVRPIGRGTMLVARYGGAVAATTVYTLGVYLLCALITSTLGDWSPANLVLAGLALAMAVAVVGAISVLVSVFLAASAQGIAVFMIFGAGLVAGLLGQIGDAVGSPNLERISDVTSTALPFEALYQAALHLITVDESGLTQTVIQLGPFGGADEAGPGLPFFALAYVAAVLGAAVYAFSRRDL